MISASFVNWLRRSSAVLAFSLLTLCALPAHAFAVYTVPGSTAVGAKAATVAVPVTFTSSGTLSTISVVTGGIAKLDFTTDGSGSCSTNSSYMAGQSCTVGVIFAPTAPGMRTGAILLMNSDGNVLATELLGANALGSVGVMVPGIINTLAGNGGWIFDGDNGPATGAQLFLPSGIAVDAAGNTYISDSGNNRVRRVDALTGIITTVAGNGNPGFSGDNGLATVATLNNPVGLALDGAGNLYIADSGNNAIRMVYATTHFITTVAGEGGIQGSSGNNGPATSALLNNPNSIAFDPAGNLYIADTGNSVIRKVTPGGTISIFAGNGTFSFSGDNGPANTAALNYPWGVAASPTGYVYIADLYNNRIRQVSPSGIITTFAGNGNSGYQGDSGLATLARLTTPADVAVDAGGNIYIADSGNNVIRKVNALTGIITTIAGEANAQINGDGGQATNADIYGPYAVVLDSADNLYIADLFRYRSRALSSSQDLSGYPAMRVDRLS